LNRGNKNTDNEHENQEMNKHIMNHTIITEGLE